MALVELALSSYSFTAEHYIERSSDQDPKFDLNAPYQRASVWTIEQRQALVKSLYMGLPIGSLIVAALPYKPGRATYRVIDGKQRIEAVRAFVADEFGVPGEWFQRRYVADPPATGQLRWSDLSTNGHRAFQGSTIPSLQFDSGIRWVHDEATGKWGTAKRNDAEMLVAEAEVYGLVNGGGTAQTAADMANAAAVAAGGEA